MSLARRAWLSRKVEVLDKTVLAILALPVNPRVHDVAHYYRAYAHRKSEDSEQIRIRLEVLVDSVLPEYRPRTLLALGNCYATARDLDGSTRIHLAAARTATGIDPLAKCQALRALALNRSYDGDHKGSLADLERLFPVMRSFAASYPEDYRYYLNNLAYELGEVGRIDEAKAAINVALRSPYADRFPDWAETKQELETKQRRLFLPLVFALGSSAVTPNAPDIAESPATVARPEQLAQRQAACEASAPTQPESQPDIQTSAARRCSPGLERTRKTAISVVLAWLACRRLRQPKPLRHGLRPTFEARGCAKSPPARAPPSHHFHF